MKYFLENPEITGSKLIPKGQIGTMPIYHCQESNSFWVLLMQLNGDRWLLKYDPHTGVINRNNPASVPADWAGEPETFLIDQECWQDLQHPSNVRHLEEIRRLLKDGNFICLLDANNRISHQLIINHDDRLVVQNM